MESIEKTLGSLQQQQQQQQQQGSTSSNSYVSSIKNGIDTKTYGIDVVLGGQWGDEGKGKLVDILSQVCTFYYVCTNVFVF